MNSAADSNLLGPDLDDVVERTSGFAELRGERVFVTGGTGFVGSWLLESLVRASDRLSLGVRIVVLTRDPAGFARNLPHIASRTFVEALQGDVETFSFPEGSFSHVIHGATPVSVASIERQPRVLFGTIVDGTRRVLDFAERCHARKLLFTSSGAVYGPQPAEAERIEESLLRGPDCTDPRATYAEGKRAAEHLCVLASGSGGPEAKIARCFGFGGPRLPLNDHYAFGNFIRDGRAGGPIRVRGDGTAIRSYLYAGDMAQWLWTILFRGASGRPYNVGSDRPVTVEELARRVGAETETTVVVERAAQRGIAGDRYVPSTERAARELGLRINVSLEETIQKTLEWHRARDGSKATP